MIRIHLSHDTNNFPLSRYTLNDKFNIIESSTIPRDVRVSIVRRTTNKNDRFMVDKEKNVS